MANRKTKIEKYGLAERVNEILRGGITVSAEIARILRQENPALEISDTAVSRYVSSIKQTLTDDAFKTIREHVEKTLPEDLDVLEELESTCLAWAREAGRDQTERVADAAVAITGEVEKWRARFTGGDTPEKLTRWIIRQCVSYLAQDDRKQDQRLKAMRQATQIIELKLKHAGLLDDEGKGRILIVNRETGNTTDPAQPGEYQPFTVIAGGEDGEG